MEIPIRSSRCKTYMVTFLLKGRWGATGSPLMKMERNLEAFNKQTFDLAVIGGGINGAAIAREAAIRGLKVVLVEAQDFASATSSRSSKLIHGGLRYLEQFHFALVHESRRERRLLLAAAPHLARPLPFVLPIYRGDPYFPLKVRLGLTLYDLMGNLGRADHHRMLSASKALRLLPLLRARDLRAAAIYFDSETDDARLTLENVLDAAAHGAVVANYTEIQAVEVNRSERAVVSAEARDRLTDERHTISARFWVNATGPWVDRVRALLPGFDGTPTVRLTRGTHLILPQLMPGHALFAAIPEDQRVFVMIPWHAHTLLGTTDTDFGGDPATVRPESADVDYLLRAVNRVLSKPLRSQDVLGAFAGLRALALEPGRSPSENTREYRFHWEEGVRNFISICGGKLTTARALAEKLLRQMHVRGPSTREAPLPGGRIGPFEAFVATATEEAIADFHVPRRAAERIARTYGSRWRLVLEPTRERRGLIEELPGTPALLAAEVDFAIRHEMALRVEDFLLRRSGLNWLAAHALREAVPAVAEIFARELSWSAEQRRSAIEDWRRMPALPQRSEGRGN
jgi:glycerol-3-phosphate dehydrogenase